MKRLVQLDIPVLTIFKLLAALTITVAIIHLWPLILLLFLSLLLAVTLHPLVKYLARFLPKGLALGLIALALFCFVAALIVWVGPPLGDQVLTLIEKLPGFTHDLLNRFSQHGFLHQIGEKLMKGPSQPDPMAYLTQAFVVGQFAVGGLSSVALVLVFAIYMVADGERTFEWLLAFFPAGPRAKLRQTAEEVSKVIFAYVAGQIITSTACGIFVFILLRLLGVEQAVVLGVLAALLDVLPILGFILTVIPAVIFALSVSGEAALITAGGFAVYHVVENYLIVPAVYGKRLRVSTLTVLISLLAGAMLAGILGAIAILPVVASYPIIEDIWLKRLLGDVVVKKHNAIEESVHGPKTDDAKAETRPVSG